MKVLATVLFTLVAIGVAIGLCWLGERRIMDNEYMQRVGDKIDDQIEAAIEAAEALIRDSRGGGGTPLERARTLQTAVAALRDLDDLYQRKKG